MIVTWGGIDQDEQYTPVMTGMIVMSTTSGEGAAPDLGSASTSFRLRHGGWWVLILSLLFL